MAALPAVTIPAEADTAHIIATIDTITRHLSALREELLDGSLPDGALTRVRALHEPLGAFCACCGDKWPCPTIRALNGEAVDI